MNTNQEIPGTNRKRSTNSITTTSTYKVEPPKKKNKDTTKKSKVS